MASMRLDGSEAGFAFWVRKAAWSLVLALMLELLVFNFPFWGSLGFGGGTDVAYTVGEGLQAQSDGSYSIVQPDSAYLEFDAGGVHIDNVAIDLSVPGWSATSWRDSLGPFITLQIEATDASSSGFFELPEITYCDGLQDSHTIRVHLSGGSDAMRVFVRGAEGLTFRIDHLSINGIRPFNFIAVRFLFLLGAVILFQVFRPSSPVYRARFDGKRLAPCCFLAVLVCLEVVGVLFVSRLSGVVDTDTSAAPNISGDVAYDFNQYDHVANALLAGELSLDLPVPESLKELENPYDASARSQALSAWGDYYYMDYAYYNGEYYSYFGVLPALTMYVPYKAVTGLDLRTDRAVSALSGLYVISANVLLVCIAARKARQVSIGSIALASLSFTMCSGLLYLAFLPQLYSVPILMGLSCVFIGLSCWIMSQRASGGYRVSLLAAGGLLVALSMDCRPQYILSALLAFPIFWDGITKERLFFSRKGLANTLAVMLPFIVVAIPTMWYNFARFGSPLDFGAAYNLTGSDMTSRGIVLARTVPALIQYLLQLPFVSAQYPFFHAVDMSVDYQGYWFYEPFLGGFLPFAPVVLTLFLYPCWRRRHELSTRLLAFACMVIAGVILFADFQIASITTRYFNDFSWLLLIATWLMLWSEEELLRRHAPIRGVLVSVTVLGCVLNALCLLSPDRYGALIASCPSIYYGLAVLL